MKTFWNFNPRSGLQTGNSDVVRVNIGCGQTPIPGWYNVDNSLSVRIAKLPMLTFLLHKMHLLSNEQKDFIAFVRKDGSIIWADATKKLPFANNSVDIIYTSHMVEHLDRNEMRLLLQETRRILKQRGIIRIAIPDLYKQVQQYLIDCDADALVERMHMARPRATLLRTKLKYAIVGDRGHLWMYDGRSMARLLVKAGFQKPCILQAGYTLIRDPGELDLYERAEESVYVEAFAE